MAARCETDPSSPRHSSTQSERVFRTGHQVRGGSAVPRLRKCKFHQLRPPVGSVRRCLLHHHRYRPRDAPRRRRECRSLIRFDDRMRHLGCVWLGRVESQAHIVLPPMRSGTQPETRRRLFWFLCRWSAGKLIAKFGGAPPATRGRVLRFAGRARCSPPCR